MFLNKIKRLTTMGKEEITSRLGQEFAKKLDALSLFQPSFQDLPVQNAAQLGRFFFALEDIPKRIELIRTHIPDFEANTLSQAEQIVNHQFPLLGYGALDYGKEINWHLDIINGKRAPLRPWSKIAYLDFEEVGDSKVTWELSRHQFLPTLAKAWLLTGEERFIRKLEELYYDWQRKNPYPMGINWASSLEVAFRSLAWIWVLQLLGGCESASKLRQDMIRALAFNAWYMRRYLSTYFSPNTHLQGEAVALFFIGTLFPSLPNAKDCCETGWKILLEHMLTKVLEDGAYFEQSTYYHVYALDFFLHARILAKRNEKAFPDCFDLGLKKMLEHLACLCQAGPPPRFGDDDGGRVFDGRRNLASHLADPLATGTAIYQFPVYKQPGVKVTEEMLWLLGEDGFQAYSECPAAENGNSARFDHTGLYVSYADLDSHSQVVFDAGPLGGGSGGHGHADALSLVLNLEGKPVLVDPGTCNYIGSGSERENFRVTQAHNTVTVDDFSQAIPKSAFSWFQWPKVTVEAAVFSSEFEFLAASHDGYTHPIQPPVTHRRTLFAPHNGFWFVVDEMVSDGSHDYALHWHLAPGLNLVRETEACWGVEMESSKLHILTAADGWHPKQECGWFSPAYGIKQPAPVLSLVKHAQGSETIATVLWVGTPKFPPPTLVALDHRLGMPAFCLTNGTSRSLFIFGDGILNIDIEGWSSDAVFFYGLTDDNDRFTKVIALQSTYVCYYEEKLHKSIERDACFVWCNQVST